MDWEKLTEAIPPDDLEFKVQHGKKGHKGMMLVLYKTARIDRARLDKVCGPENWQCSFREIFEGDKLVGVACTISIRINNEWISKTDVGTPSAYDPIKGAYSDAIKRAGTAWGIGVELYKKPVMWVPYKDEDTFDHKDNPIVRGWVFEKSQIIDQLGRVRFPKDEEKASPRKDPDWQTIERLADLIWKGDSKPALNALILKRFKTDKPGKLKAQEKSDLIVYLRKMEHGDIPKDKPAEPPDLKQVLRDGQEAAQKGFSIESCTLSGEARDVWRAGWKEVTELENNREE